MAIVRKEKGGSPKKATTKIKPERNGSVGNDRLSLPIKANDPPKSIFQYCISIHGEKGVGKSTLASMFPDSIDFMWEPRRRNLPIVQVPQAGERPLNWSRQLEYIDMVIDSGRFKTVIIDTVDRMYNGCLDHVCYELGIKHPSSMNDYGATWRDIADRLEEAIGRLLLADIQPILLSHAQLKEVTSRTGRVHELIVPTCAKGAYSFMQGACDLAFYYGYHGRDRALTIRGNELVWAACGLEKHFLAGPKDSRPISTISMGENPQEGYRNLLEAFDNKLSSDKYILVEDLEEFGTAPDSENDSESTELPDDPKGKSRK